MKLAFPTPIRLAALAAIAVLSFATACSDGNSELQGRAGQGQVRIQLAGATSTTALVTGDSISATDSMTWGDDDRPSIESANVTFASILARNLDGELIDVTIDLPVTVNVFTLFEGQTVSLPIGFLTPGVYDQIVVVMTRVDLLLGNGTEVSITPPGGGWTVIVPTEQFTVAEGEMTTVTLRLRRDRLFEWLGDHFEFHPGFDCEVDDDRDDD